MKKVIAFIGSARKKHTHAGVGQFFDHLQSLAEVDCEPIVLSDYRIETCRGCRVCFDQGEELCPLKDDRDILLQKMHASDGVVFASPVYSFQVTAIMKIFLDRLGFVFHRPCFFGKTCSSIAVEAIHGGGDVVKYLDFCGYAMGFNKVSGSRINSLEPITEKQKGKTDTILAGHARRFQERLARPAFPKPTLLSLMAFRMSRTSMRMMLNQEARDYRYFEERGWFEAPYYYPAELTVAQKAAGRLFDAIAAGMVRRR